MRKTKKIKMMADVHLPWLVRHEGRGFRTSYQPAEILELDEEIADWLIERGKAKVYEGDEPAIEPEFWEAAAPQELKRPGWQQRAWNRMMWMWG